MPLETSDLAYQMLLQSEIPTQAVPVGKGHLRHKLIQKRHAELFGKLLSESAEIEKNNNMQNLSLMNSSMGSGAWKSLHSWKSDLNGFQLDA